MIPLRSLRLFIKHGAKVNVKGKFQPLAEAVRLGSIPAIKILLKHGAKINKPDMFGTPLTHADNPKVIKLLKSAGAK